MLAEGLGLYGEHEPDSHRTRRKVVKLAAYPLWQNNLIFPTPTGITKIEINLLSRHFKPLLNNVALPRIHFNELRHTCATIPLMAGKRPKYVQKLLGHASISITLDTCSHVIEGTDGGLANAMDDAL